VAAAPINMLPAQLFILRSHRTRGFATTRKQNPRASRNFSGRVR